MIKVSVIVPVYNVEKYIRKCLESLVNQTLGEIQVIIVDDGSTDSSATIVKEYIETFPKMQYYKKENGGLSDARNYGLQYATGAYIAFLDSDDYVEENMYERMYEKAKKENSDMVECNFYWQYSKKKKVDIGERYAGKKEMLEKARVMAWNKLYKREILEQGKAQFPKGLQYEDIGFFYLLIPYIESVSFVKEPLVHYVQRKKSIINTQNEKAKDVITVLNQVLDSYKEHKWYDTYREVLEYSYTRILLCSSIKRISKIKDKRVYKRLLNETWMQLNEHFPHWKQNKILSRGISFKKIYLRSINRISYRIYTRLFRIFK